MNGGKHTLVQPGTATFSSTVEVYKAGGWEQVAMLPLIPGSKRPGRWLGKARGWCGLTGRIFKEGLAGAKEPTSWDQVDRWPTDSVGMRGTHYPGLDIDSEDAQVHDLVHMAIPGLEWMRGRIGSQRTLVPFEADNELITSWRPIRFTMPGSTTPHMVELIGHGKHWVASGKHPSGKHYAWRDASGWRAGPPPVAALPMMTQAYTDELRTRLVHHLRRAGATFLDGSDKAVPTRHTNHTEVATDDREPLLSMELFEEVLHAIPDTHETVGGWDEAIPILASMRYVLGREGIVLPDCIEIWAGEFPGVVEGWAMDRWQSFDGGVAVREGTFLKWVDTHAPPELAKRVSHAISDTQNRAVLADIIEDDEPQDMPAAAPLKQSPNVLQAMSRILSAPELKGAFGYCQFRRQVVLRKPIPLPDGRARKGFVERPWEDSDDLAVLCWLQAHGLPKLTKSTCIDACSEVARLSPFHPVRDYLHGLVWDGVPRLDTWLEDYCDAVGDPAYLKAVGRSVMVSAVARVMRPGCKVDTVMVLDGRQGIGKSTLFKAMVPDPDWFSESMPHDVASKDAKMHLRGKVFIELSELAQLKRSEAAALKNFVTTATDIYRASYDRHEMTVPRQSVFVGSTNEKQYLADEAGNRRFLPVRLEGAVDLPRVAANRDQIWAEAYTAYKAGEQWWLTDEVAELAEEEQSARLQIHPWAAKVEQFIEEKGLTEVTTEMLLRDAIQQDYAQMTPVGASQVGKILVAMGWKRTKQRHAASQGKPRWVYRSPGWKPGGTQ
jgi:predicted P-loop ATPase